MGVASPRTQLSGLQPIAFSGKNAVQFACSFLHRIATLYDLFGCRDRECAPIESSLHLSKIPIRATCQLFQHVLGKHSVASEFDPPVEQVNNYVLGLLADRCNVFHLDDEFASTKVGSCLLPLDTYSLALLPRAQRAFLPQPAGAAWRYQ